MSEVFSILLHNRQRYEQGKEGLWFSLPTTTEKLQEALREIGISADNPQDFFLYDYRSLQERPVKLPRDLVLSADVDELNFLAARLEKLDAAELAELNAALTSPQSDFHSIGQIIDYPDNVDYFVHLPDVTGTGQLGDYYLNRSGMVDMPEEWKAGIFLPRFGLHIANTEHGVFTDYGYLVKSGDEWQRVHEGQPVPEKYRVLAYAVELTGKVRGVIRGNLYELDYPQHFRHVAAEAVQADNIILHYEKGDREQPAGLYFDGRPDPNLGAFLRYEAKPNEPEHLRELLRHEQKGRAQLAPGDFKSHVTALHDSMILAEAQRIVAGLKDLSAPNSPNKTHFMVELSPYFVQIASSKDTDRLFSMLPYKSLCFTGMKDRHGLYAVIGKDENRDKEVRRPRASILRQLSETKQAQASKKAPARTKKNELEV